MDELHDWVESLVNLHETDCKIDRMKEQIESAPKLKKEAQSKIETQHASALQAKENLRKKELQISNANADIESTQQKINKLLLQANTVKNNDSYRALLVEIDKLKLVISEKEEVVLVLMEELEVEKKHFKEAQEVLKEAVKQVEQTIADLNLRVENCKKQIEVLTAKKIEQEKLVNADLLEKYQRIKHGHGGKRVALVEINGDKCGSCHLKLTTQEILQAKKRAPFTTCGNCGSLIYS